MEGCWASVTLWMISGRALRRCHDRPAMSRKADAYTPIPDRQAAPHQTVATTGCSGGQPYIKPDRAVFRANPLTLPHTNTNCIPPHISVFVLYCHCPLCHRRASVTFAFVFLLSSRTPPQTRCDHSVSPVYVSGSSKRQLISFVSVRQSF